MRHRKPAALAWGLLILALCTVPGQSIPGTGIVSLDKVVHFVLFFVLAWLWRRSSPWKGTTAAVLIGGTLYAAFTEIYQGWLPWERSPDPLDFLANVVGLLAGVLFFTLFKRARKQSEP